MFSLLTNPRGGSKLDAIPGAIRYLGVTFHQNGVIFGECVQICEISHRFISFSVGVVAYSDYLIEFYELLCLN